MLKKEAEKPKKIMVIGGTSDSRHIIDRLLNKNLEVLATVATSYGESLLEVRQGLRIFQGKMDDIEMENFIKDREIEIVVDASHPFAENVSINAIKACEKANVEYIRFERQNQELDSFTCHIVESYEEAANIAAKLEGNIFLTTGSNTLEVFTSYIKDYKERLFVRVLPDSKVMLKCESLGISASNIIAMRGPFSKDLNKEMLKACNAKVLVTKDSGEAGGVCEKKLAAAELGIETIVIKRPKINYQNVYRDIETLIDKVATHSTSQTMQST